MKLCSVYMLKYQTNGSKFMTQINQKYRLDGLFLVYDHSPWFKCIALWQQMRRMSLIEQFHWPLGPVYWWCIGTVPSGEEVFLLLLSSDCLGFCILAQPTKKWGKVVKISIKLIL